VRRQKALIDGFPTLNCLQRLGGGETGALGGCDTGEREFVATNSDADAVFLFFRTADRGHEAAVGDNTVRWDAGARNKKIVFVPVGMRAPLPWARRPRSLARGWVQISLSGPRLRWRYSKD